MTAIAIVPAKDRADSIGATVAALARLGVLDGIVVVDDGSADATSEAAAGAGASVVRLPANRGKGAAVAAGVEASPDADVYLLIDADLGDTAGLAEALLGPVLAGEADMTVAVLPSAGTRGGFGSVRRLAAAGIRRATGFAARAPLSGQRAVRGELLRSLHLADRFGLEVGMTVDAIRAGARVVEVDVPMDHRHTGRRLAGFRHRAGQGMDIVRSLWPRLTSPRARIAIILATFAVATTAAIVSGSRSEPVSRPASAAFSKVVIFGMPGLAWDDVGTGRLATLDGLIERGASSATNVRTVSKQPSTAEGYATLGAGTRVAAEDDAGIAFDDRGGVVVAGAAATRELNDGRFRTSHPGALGDALHRAGRRTAVVGNADVVPGERGAHRPAAVALMDGSGSIDTGNVSDALLRRYPASPSGYAADPAAVISAVERAVSEADVVLVDPGDLDRSARSEEARIRALRSTDDLLAEVAERVPDTGLLVVVSVVPPATEWRLTPMVLVGRGVPHGYLHSPSTRRAGLVTLTDVAPTVLAALGVAKPEGMIGNPFRYRPGPVDLAQFRILDRDAAYREGIYLPLIVIYVAVQVLAYLYAIVTRLGSTSRGGRRALGAVALGIAAYPLATLVFRAIPNVAALGRPGVGLLLLIDAAIVAVAARARRHALSPLAWILGFTVAALAADVATGARLQASGLLGYSLQTVSRFTGFGNTAFGLLAAATVLLGAIHVAFAPRRREALAAVACLFAFVVVIDGAPGLGSDVGGILTLVPVLGLTLVVLSGRRLGLRALFTAAVVTAAALALASGIDLLRPPATRTHLGRLLVSVGEGGVDVLASTASRRLAVNLERSRSPWSVAVVIGAASLLLALVRSRGWKRLVPPGSALRAGVIGALAAGLLGSAVNDSGAVVVATVFVFVGPLLTLMALERQMSTGVP